MQNMTVDQVTMIFDKQNKERLQLIEVHSAVVCSMLAGKYKKQTKAREMSLDELASKGILKEN